MTLWITEHITRKEKKLIQVVRTLPPDDLDRLIETAEMWKGATLTAETHNASKAKGGYARAAKLAPAKRKQIATQAAQARWAKK